MLPDEFEMTRIQVSNLETRIRQLEAERIIGKGDMKVLYDYRGNQLSRVFSDNAVFYEIHVDLLHQILEYYQIPAVDNLRNLVLAQVHRDIEIAKLRNRRTKLLKGAFDKFHPHHEGFHLDKNQKKLPGF